MKSKDIDKKEQLTLNFDVDSDAPYVATEKSFSKADVVYMFERSSSPRSSSQSSALKRILEKAEKISW